MIIQINEQFHNHEVVNYYANTELLDSKNPVDNVILKACKKKSFQLNIDFDGDKFQEDYPEEENPEITGKAIVKLPKSTKPEKVVNLNIIFDC